MLRRAILTFAVLSYLTCVLILSGLQKSETEVNSTEKLEGHNENYTQENNEDLHRELLLNNSVANMKQMKIIKTPLRKSSILFPEKKHDNCSLLNNISNDAIDKSSLRIGNNIGRDRRTVTTKENIEEPSTSIENDTDAQIENGNMTQGEVDADDKSIIRNESTFWKNTTEKSLETTIKSSIINDTTTTVTEEPTKAHTIPTETEEATILKAETESIISNTESVDIMDDEELNNLLKEYDSKEKTGRTTTTSKATIDTAIDDDSDIFNYLLNTPDKSSAENHKFKAQISKYSYELNFSKHKTTTENKITAENDIGIQPDKDLDFMSIRDFENLEEENVPNTDKPASNDHISSDEVFKSYRNSKVGRNLVTSKYYTQFSIIKDIISPTTLPPDFIQQIAENVKKLIMKDLHKEIITSTIGPTAATTESASTSNKNLIVIEKIMELLQKYKTENNVAVTQTTECKKKVTEKQTFHKILKKHKHAKLNSVKDNGKASISPYLNYPYKIPPYLKIPMRIQMENPGQHYSIPNPNVAPSVITNSKPITIQTNLIEIPPLGVPVPNPVSLISHTIIISTLRPSHLKAKKQKKQKYFKQHTTPNKYKVAETGDIIIRSKFKNNRENKKRLNQYRIGSDDDITDINKSLAPNTHKASLYSNVHKFHERLENYNSNNLQSGEDCCKDEIFTREQRPLNNMKKRNDASFKHLLKTQQRVTDMLERLLAKNKSEMPISVETT